MPKFQFKHFNFAIHANDKFSCAFPDHWRTLLCFWLSHCRKYSTMSTVLTDLNLNAVRHSPIPPSLKQHELAITIALMGIIIIIMICKMFIQMVQYRGDIIFFHNLTPSIYENVFNHNVSTHISYIIVWQCENIKCEMLDPQSDVVVFTSTNTVQTITQKDAVNSRQQGPKLLILRSKYSCWIVTNNDPMLHHVQGVW